MKTIMSQCLTKPSRKHLKSRYAMARTNTDDNRETCDASRCTIEMAKTVTEARENPDRLLCAKLI